MRHVRWTLARRCADGMGEDAVTDNEKFQFWLNIRAEHFKLEIRHQAEQQQRDLRDFIRFQNRSAGQVRRFQIAQENRK